MKFVKNARYVAAESHEVADDLIGHDLRQAGGAVPGRTRYAGGLRRPLLSPAPTTVAR